MYDLIKSSHTNCQKPKFIYIIKYIFLSLEVCQSLYKIVQNLEEKYKPTLG